MGEDGMRIDKYLKVSRLIKRRSVAADACDGDRILINGREAKPGKEVKEGDVVEIRFGGKSVRVRVTSTAETVRKEDASSMYEVLP